MDRLVTPGRCFALALAAGLSWGCQRGAEQSYQGRVFELAKPSAEGWTLVSDPARFAFPTSVPRPDSPDVAKWKVVELAHREERTVAEVFLVRPANARTRDVMDVLLRARQRRNLARGRPKTTKVGGRTGQASIAIWRQTRHAPKHYFYVVRVPLDDALWCFVGTAPSERFETARGQFRTILDTVRFHARPSRTGSKT